MKQINAIQNYLFYTTFISEILPLIFCVLFYKKLNTKALKAFFIYAIILCFFSVASLIAIKILKDRVIYFLLFRLFSLIEYSIIVIFIYHILHTGAIRKIILLSIVPFILFAVSDYIVSDKNQFNTHSNIPSALLLILFIIYFFYEKMKTVVLYPLYQTSSFWICVGFFLYFTGTFFFFIFIKSSTDKEFIRQMNFIYGLVTVSKNILLSIAMFVKENAEDIDDSLHIPTDLNLDEFSLTTHKNP